MNLTTIEVRLREAKKEVQNVKTLIREGNLANTFNIANALESIQRLEEMIEIGEEMRKAEHEIERLIAHRKHEEARQKIKKARQKWGKNELTAWTARLESKLHTLESIGPDKD